MTMKSGHYNVNIDTREKVNTFNHRQLPPAWEKSEKEYLKRSQPEPTANEQALLQELMNQVSGKPKTSSNVKPTTKLESEFKQFQNQLEREDKLALFLFNQVTMVNQSERNLLIGFHRERR